MAKHTNQVTVGDDWVVLNAAGNTVELQYMSGSTGLRIIVADAIEDVVAADKGHTIGPSSPFMNFAGLAGKKVLARNALDDGGNIIVAVTAF